MSGGKKIHWTIASARQNFPTVIDLAAREPQEIYRRDRLVARVVAADASASPIARRTLGDALSELHAICAAENYTLEVGKRRDRPNAFLLALEELERDEKRSMRGRKKARVTSRAKRSTTKRARSSGSRRKK